MSDAPDTLVADFATTPHYGLLKPTTDSDDDLWGTHWNQNADTIDSLIWTINSAGYVSQSAGDARWLNVTGDTMTGPLTLAADPASAMQPVTLQYLQANTPTIASGDARWVNVSGDTMSGGLAIKPPSGTAFVNIDRPVGDNNTAAQIGAFTASKLRWLMQLGTAETESGSNAGSNFGIFRYDDAGAYLGNPLRIDRSTGNVTVAQSQFIGVGLNVGNGNAVTDPLTIDVAQNNYARMRYNVRSTRLWTSGCDNLGRYVIADETAGQYRFWIETTGDAHAANLYAAYLNSAGWIDAAGQLRSMNGRIIAQGSSNPALTAYNTAGFAAGMWCESGGTLSWGWCNTAGTPTDTRMYLNTSGNLYVAGNIRGTGFVGCDGTGLNGWGINSPGCGYWMKFDWDGTNVPVWANGGYACTLVSSTWTNSQYKAIGAYTPNQNVDYGSGPTFGNIMNTQGTFYVAGNYAYYLGRNVNSGYWNFIEGSVSSFEIRPDGSIVMYKGQAFKPGGGVWADSSDRRIKTVVGEYSRGLAEVLQIRPIYYRFKGNDANPETKIAQPVHQDTATLRAGLVAQEVEDVLPEMVTLGPGFLDGDAIDDMRTLDLTTLPLALVNAVKELHARVAYLERIVS